MRTCTKWGVGVASALLAAAGAAHGAFSFETVARTSVTGTFGPSMGSDTFANASQFSSYYVNHNNQVTFTATLTSGPQGRWRWEAGPNNINDGVVGVTASPFGGTFGGFIKNYQSSGGTILHRDGTGTTAKYAYYNGGTYTAVAKGGSTMEVPDSTGTNITGVTFNSFGNGWFNNGSRIALASSVAGAGVDAVSTSATNNSEALFIGDPTTPGGLKMALRRNDATDVVDVRVGAFLSQLSVESPMVLTTTGKFALFTASGTNSVKALQGAGVTQSTSSSAADGNDQALLSDRDGSLKIIARRGSTADASDGAVFRILGSGGSGPSIAMSSSGRIAFYSTLRGGSIPPATTNNAGLFVNDGVSNQIIARTGKFISPSSGLPQATGVTGGAVWGTSFLDLVMNNNNNMAWRVTGLTGTGITLNQNDSAIFTMNTSDSGPKLLAQNFTHAGDISNLLDVKYSGFSNIAMNNYGLVVFTAGLTGADVRLPTQDVVGTNTGLFVADANGNVSLVLRRGFDVNGGTSGALINSFSYNISSSTDGRAMSLNDKGQLLVEIGYFDGSRGLYLFSVPAPSALPALALGGLFAARRRRNH